MKNIVKSEIKYALGIINLHILWKESLNSYGQKFHQYQQNKHFKELNTKRPRHVALEIRVSACDSHKNVAELTG
jgi:hypothetical protein